MSTELDWVEGSLHTHPAMTRDGLVRRNAMREMLQAAVVTRRRRRQAYRWAAAAVVILAALLVWPGNTPTAEPSGLKNVAFETVRNDPGVLARYQIDDDELLQLCREVGRPTGLIRMKDKLILTAEVADGGN